MSNCTHPGNCSSPALVYNGRSYDLCWSHIDNDEREEILARLTEVQENPASTCLVDFDFSGQVLRDQDFVGGNLSGIQLKGALLVNVKFLGTNLNGADFSGAQLRNVTFGCDALGKRIDFSRARLEECVFENCDFGQAMFRRSRLERVRFEKVHLEESAFALCGLLETHFVDCSAGNSDLQNLRCVRSVFHKGDFERCFFSDSIFVGRVNTLFEGVALQGSEFRRTSMSGEDGGVLLAFDGCDLANCSFDSAQFDFCRFQGADSLMEAISCEFNNAGLRKVDFFKVRLTSANFSAAYLEEVSFEDCEMNAARFENASLAGSRFLGIEKGASSIFQAADFSRCTIRDCKFVSSVFNQASFSGCELKEVGFGDAAFIGASLESCILEDVKLTDADLTSISIEEDGGQRTLRENCNFSGADFSYADLEEINLSGCILERSTFDNTKLRGTLLHGACCGEARFILCDLQGVQANEAIFTGARLIDCKLNGFVSRGGFFTSADLTGSSVYPPKDVVSDEMCADLQGCDFRSAVLQNCDLRRVDFTGSKLGRAILDGSDMRASVLKQIDASSASFRGVRFGDGDDHDGSGSRPADLSDGFVARRASFEGAEFNHCNLTGADFSYARLDNAIFSRAHIKDCRFTGVSMVGVQHFDEVLDIEYSKEAPDFSFAHIEATKAFIWKEANQATWNTFKKWLNFPPAEGEAGEVRRLSWVAWKNNYESLGLYTEQGLCFREEQIAKGWERPHRWHPFWHVMSLMGVLGVFLLVVGALYGFLAKWHWLGWSSLAAVVIGVIAYLFGRNIRLQLLVSDFLYGFGEQPIKIFANGFATVCLFAFLYWFGDYLPWGEVKATASGAPDPS